MRYTRRDNLERGDRVVLVMTIGVGRHLNQTLRLQLANGFALHSGPEGCHALGDLPDIFFRQADIAEDDLTATASSAAVKSEPKLMRRNSNDGESWT